MMTTYSCADIRECGVRYVDGALTPEERHSLEMHLTSCVTCRATIKRFRAVNGLMQSSLGPAALNANFIEQTNQRLKTGRVTAAETFFNDSKSTFADSWQTRMGSAPWWGVSLALHVLVILLAGLISMSLEMPTAEDAVVVVTELQPAAQIKQIEPEKPKVDNRVVLESKHDTPPTDPDSSDPSDIVVPPEVLAMAELGDHWETINLDCPDTHSAFGNPESHIFYDKHGNDEPEGGGGMGGCSLDNLIGVGGNASPGSGGGWGGGHGTGIGVGTGPGKGSFGSRTGGGRRWMVKKHGGSRATETAVDLGLEWLARHQEKDGFWDTDKYLDNKEVRYGGNAHLFASFDPGITGLATLAFLGAGHTLKVGKYKDNVQRAISWLLTQQGANGEFTAKVPCHEKSVIFYCHCIATLACAEALSMSGGRDFGADGSPGEAGKGGLRASVEKGIELILEWQRVNTTGGWTYYNTVPHVCDPTVTGWAVMALKAAKIAGIKIPAEAISRAKEATVILTKIDKNKGDYGRAIVGYLAPNAIQFNSKGYACTAAGMVINLFLGMDPQEEPVIAGAGLITQEDALPSWIFKPQDPHTDHQNLYYWYYGTLGCFQIGGDAWKKWNAKLKAALIPNQRKDGDAVGSWNPDDVWGAWGGRVYSTALSVLCMEVYYRYAKCTAK